MLGNISRVYQNLISKLNTLDTNTRVFNNYHLNKDFINGFGTIMYNVNQRGFYGIVDANGDKYFPINYKQFCTLHLDRKQIQFSLRLHPDVSNMYRWGKSVELISLQVVN